VPQAVPVGLVGSRVAGGRVLGVMSRFLILFDRFIAARLVQPEFHDCWRVVDDIDAVIPTLRATSREPARLPLHMGDVA
jgi:hypothetical protein